MRARILRMVMSQGAWQLAIGLRARRRRRRAAPRACGRGGRAKTFSSRSIRSTRRSTSPSPDCSRSSPRFRVFFPRVAPPASIPWSRFVMNNCVTTLRRSALVFTNCAALTCFTFKCAALPTAVAARSCLRTWREDGAERFRSRVRSWFWLSIWRTKRIGTAPRLFRD